MSEVNNLQNMSSPEVDRLLQGVKGLWTPQDLVNFLRLPNIQSVYDLRYQGKLDSSVFVMCGRKLRIIPHRAVELALKGELIKV